LGGNLFAKSGRPAVSSRTQVRRNSGKTGPTPNTTKKEEGKKKSFKLSLLDKSGHPAVSYHIYVRGKTGSALNAKKNEEEAKKKCFKLSIDRSTWQGDDNFKLKMVKYLTCVPKLEYMMIVVRVEAVNLYAALSRLAKC
jgi:hypothetical protein